LTPMYHGEEPEEVSEREKQIGQWMLYNGLSRKEAELWWKEGEEVKAFREKWDREQGQRISEAVGAKRMEWELQGIRGDEIQQRDVLYRVELMDLGDVAFQTALRELREAQVKRRKHKGRFW
jgi:hypothetical protein